MVAGSMRGQALVFFTSALIVSAMAVSPARPQSSPADATAQARQQSRQAIERRQPGVTFVCAFPWTYSQGLGRCVCLREGYGLVGGRCVEVAATPQPPRGNGDAARAPVRERPPAVSGDTQRPGERPAQPREAVRPAAAPAAPPPAPAAGPVPATVTPALVQACLREAGFFKGTIRDHMTNEAWTAVWHFKQRHPHGRTPEGIANRNFQRTLFPLCPQTTQGRTDVAARGAAPGEGERAVASPAAAQAAATPEPAAEARRTYARPELDCLPDDLHRLIVAPYGARRDLRRCAQTCIAIPGNLSRSEIDDYAARHDIAWCKSCLEIEAHLPLDEILRIERGTNTQLCARAPGKLPRWGQSPRPPRQPYAMVRAIYRAYPPTLDPGNRVAVVIGNRNYGKGLPVNETAHNGAASVYALLTEHMGHTTEDVIDLREATLKDMRDVFATDGTGELERRLARQPNASVLIYYAGYATTAADMSESYLLPVDAVPFRETRTGYPMSELYASLRRLKAKSVLLLIEAGFGRDQSDFVFAPNVPELATHGLPADPIPGLTVMTAAERDQKSLDDPQYGIGLFTRYVVEGLAGGADRPPIGNGDRRIDAVELYAFTAHMVRMAARKSYGLLQSPSVSRLGNLVVSGSAAAARQTDPVP